MIICCCDICHQQIKDGDYHQKNHFCQRHEALAGEYLSGLQQITLDGLTAMAKNVEKYRNQVLRESNGQKLKAVENAG